MISRDRTRALVLIVMMAAVVTAGAAEDYSIDWWTMDGGGAMLTTGGGFELSGTVGQPDAGTVLSGGDIELTGGFWTVSLGGSAIPGDCDFDGDVDVDDYACFAGCMTGPRGGLPTDCDLFDFDADDDVDLFDFAEFNLMFTGE